MNEAQALTALLLLVSSFVCLLVGVVHAMGGRDERRRREHGE
jgi:hypothetical protein